MLNSPQNSVLKVNDSYKLMWLVFIVSLSLDVLFSGLWLRGHFLQLRQKSCTGSRRRTCWSPIFHEYTTKPRKDVHTADIPVITKSYDEQLYPAVANRLDDLGREFLMTVHPWILNTLFDWDELDHKIFTQGNPVLADLSIFSMWAIVTGVCLIRHVHLNIVLRIIMYVLIRDIYILDSAGAERSVVQLPQENSTGNSNLKLEWRPGKYCFYHQSI